MPVRRGMRRQMVVCLIPVARQGKHQGKQLRLLRRLQLQPRVQLRQLPLPLRLPRRSDKRQGPDQLSRAVHKREGSVRKLQTRREQPRPVFVFVGTIAKSD